MSEQEELKFFKSEYSLEDLDQFRDENGFIDLSKTDIVFTKESREKKGTEARLKNWVDFNGKKALIRGEAVKNYSVYAELIIEEIAKQLGIETAHYDLVKTKDEDGNYIYGVLSESIIDFDKEELITLHDLIGDEPEYEDEDALEALEYEDVTTYTFTINKIRERLEKAGYDEQSIDKLLEDYNKRLLFYLSVVDTDKHPENIAFIKDKSGNSNIRLSPNYDSEFSLLLEYEPETIAFFLADDYQLREEVDIASPKIGIYVSKDDGGLGSMWKDTLERICEDDEAYDYYMDELSGVVDMKEVLANVERRIHATLPEDVKKMAEKVYKLRNKEMTKVLMGEVDLDIEDEKQVDPYSFLYSMINNGIAQGIKTSDQINVGQSMQNDIEAKRNVNLENKDNKEER